MRFNYRFFISLLCIVIWISSIFYLSGMSSESNGKSKESVVVVVNVIVVGNKLGIVNESTSRGNINGINMLIRKFMHAFMYFVLAILLIRFFSTY